MNGSAQPSFFLRRMLAGIVLLAAAVSLLLPYVHRVTPRTWGKFHAAEGYEYIAAIPVVVLLAACTVLLFGKKRIMTVAAACLAILACGGNYLLWVVVTYQSLYCDCDYGVGFYVLSAAGGALFMLSIAALIPTPRKKHKQRKELLDELPD